MTRIQIRRDTSNNWATYNPILADGEFALETDTRKIKIGNGEQPYNDLSYQDAEIPQANATTLGGVRANPKTDEDTQPVNIDAATGLLYTKAGGTIEYIDGSNSQTDLKAKLDEKVPLIVKVYQNGQNGYIVYSNKLCHQWGYVDYPGGPYTQFDINLLKTLKDVNYFVGAIVSGITGNSGDSSAFRVIALATNKFTVRYVGSGNNSSVVTGGYWQAIGYLPEE